VVGMVVGYLYTSSHVTMKAQVLKGTSVSTEPLTHGQPQLAMAARTDAQTYAHAIPRPQLAKPIANIISVHEASRLQDIGAPFKAAEGVVQSLTMGRAGLSFACFFLAVGVWNRLRATSPRLYSSSDFTSDMPKVDRRLKVMLDTENIQKPSRATLASTSISAAGTASGPSFANVGGSANAKADLQEVVDFLSNPSKYTSLGAKIPKGCLLTGPSGTGKTLMAKAVASEAGVPLFTWSPTEYVESPFEASARIRKIFADAKDSTPCVIFIDELDVRTPDTVMNQLLAEMDNLDVNKVLIVLAATKNAAALEPALLRPGRFNRQVNLQYPDIEEREEILKILSTGMAMAENLDWSAIAKLTFGFSPNDLRNLLNEAAITTAQYESTEITEEEISFACDRFLVGPDRQSRLMGLGEKKLLAYQEAGLAVLAALVPFARTYDTVTIVPYGSPSAADRYMPKVDVLDTLSSDYLENQMMVALGGVVAGRLVYADTDIITNVQRSLQEVRQAATSIMQYNQKVTQATLNDEVDDLLDCAFERASGLLRRNMDALDEIAALLVEREAVSMLRCVEIVEDWQTRASSVPPPDLSSSVPSPQDGPYQGPLTVEDDLQDLLEILPMDIRQILRDHPERHNLLEIIFDLGREPLARFLGKPGGVQLRSAKVTKEELSAAERKLGAFGGDNRAGLPGTLHRVSALRNRQGNVTGLTCRIGRATAGRVDMIKDLLLYPTSMLFLGPPGVGKTTVLREVSRQLANVHQRRVVIVDTSNEIGGDGDIPHPAVGDARRMQVENPSQQHRVMIEAVENHMPEVVVIDEIGTAEETMACRTIAERGVILIATAHGRVLQNLIQNPSLNDLVGGIKSVTISDEMAAERQTSKSVLERQAPATFPLVIEIRDRNHWVIHAAEQSVDRLLNGQEPTVQDRKIMPDGKPSVTKSRYDMGTGRKSWEEEFKDEASYMPAELQQSVGGGKGIQQMRMGTIRVGGKRRVNPRGKK